MNDASRAYYDTFADTGSHEEAERAAALKECEAEMLAALAKTGVI